MSHKVTAFCAEHRDNYERNYYHCQDRVGTENREIDRSRHPLPGEPGNAVMLVIHNVRNQKQYRGRQRCKLAITVSDNVPAPDKKVTAG
jgi:hypothetical protein